MFASIFNGIKARKQRKAAEKEQKNALQALDSQQTQLDNLFNSEYYGDYINRSDNQALLKNLRKQTQQLNQQTLTQSAVTGATPEAIAAQQNYINHSVAINDKRYNTYMNASNMFRNASENALQNVGRRLENLDNTILSMAKLSSGML